MRNFPKTDLATESNLRSLEALSQQDGEPGDFQLIDSLVVSAIETMAMLPPLVARHFDRSAFMIMGAHGRGDDRRRVEIWRRLAPKLARGLDRVVADAELAAGLSAGERRQTRGERIAEICHEISRALAEGGDLGKWLSKLEQEALGTPAGGDARAMRRLLSMRRIPDMARWRADFHHAVAHAERIASELHSIPAENQS